MSGSMCLRTCDDVVHQSSEYHSRLFVLPVLCDHFFSRRLELYYVTTGTDTVAKPMCILLFYLSTGCGVAPAAA
jgi:hypothetical protein